MTFVTRIVTVLLLACAAAHATPSARANPPSSRAPDQRLTALATRIGTAALAGDRDTVTATLVTFEQAVALSKRAGTRGRDRWNEDVDDFFRAARRDRTHAVVVDARVVHTGKLTPAKDEVTREIEYAFVQLTIEADCDGCSTPRLRTNERVFRMLFLGMPDGWRFAVHP